MAEDCGGENPADYELADDAAIEFDKMCREFNELKAEVDHLKSELAGIWEANNAKAVEVERLKAWVDDLVKELEEKADG